MREIGIYFFLLLSIVSCTEQNPNVLLVVVDDLRPLNDAITPSIDELAQKGIHFTNAFAQYANCAPSRQSFLTGLSPVRGTRGGNLNHYLKDNPQVSMPLYFKQNGYTTASFGKVYHGSKEDRKAWDYFHDIPFREGFHPWESYGSLMNRQIENTESRPAVENEVEPLKHYNDYKISVKAMEFLEANKKKPFFMAVGFRKPHLPFAAPKQFWDLYPRDQFKPSAYDTAPVLGDTIVYQWSELASYAPYSSDYKSENYRNKKVSLYQSGELQHGYYACVSYIDHLVGLLLAKLKNLALDKKTIVVLAGDHGFHLGEQQIWGKHSNYKLSTHVPLIIYVPNFKTDENEREGFVELLDLYPTLAELTGLDPAEKVDGKSLVPLIYNQNAPGFSSAFSMYQSFQKDENIKDLKAYAIHKKNLTYIEWRNPLSNEIVNREFYQFKEGGSEQHNLAFETKNSTILKKLSGEINQYLSNTLKQ